MLKLKNNTLYTNSGNMFSRVFLVENNLNRKNLIILEEKEDLKKLKKIWEFVSKKGIYIIENVNDFLGFLSKDTGIFVMSSEILSEKFTDKYNVDKNIIKLIRGQNYGIENLISKLIEFSYKYSLHLSKPGSYNREGDIVNIVDEYENKIYKISFFDSEIDEILLLDNYDDKTFLKLDTASFGNLDIAQIESKKSILDTLDSFKDYLKNTNAFLFGFDLWENKEKIIESLEPIIFSDIKSSAGVKLDFGEIKLESIGEFEENLKKGNNKIVIYTRNSHTIKNFIEYNNIISDIQVIDVPNSLKNLESFKIETGKNTTSFICDDILSEIFIEKRIKKSLAKNLDLLLEIKSGDYVVHIDHGIGIFNKIEQKDLSGIKREYIEIEYREKDKLFVPISELHRISKYIGDNNPKLTRLNTTEWQKVIKGAKDEVEKVAKELLEIYAKRALVTGFAHKSFPKEENEFRVAFQYPHTVDQDTCIREILQDMENLKPMDRLLVGDVGFGKTEVAMNAIYKAFLNNKQSLFISPLVILAYEHFESLKKRLDPFGIKTEILTRVTTQKEAKAILQKMATGEINCVIGTHRLLSEDIQMKNLGLIVIDEEHKFGVIDKEKLNKIKSNYDILSLSATPIPRSLNFALNGIKDISIISTPPPSKKTIDTYISLWSDKVVLDVIKNEFERGGQVIFIHNRVSTIEHTKIYLQKLLPKEAKITITHGQMNGLEVEDRIFDFKNQKYNILLSTTVIENGVNFHNANTIIIDSADNFGLAQLHQLRGRVGRGSIKGYAYLLYRKENLADDAKKRLITIVNNTHLGAGFEIALRDLEIRGAGDILGIKQSGKSSDTGISLYLKLLEEKVEELKTGKKSDNINCKIELNISYFIKDSFFSSENDKLHFFRNIESIDSIEDLDFAYETFKKGNDELEDEFENLFLLLKARIVLSKYKVTSLKKVGQSYVFEFDNASGVENIRNFLENIDTDKNFVLISIHKIKVDTRHYRGDKDILLKISEK